MDRRSLVRLLQTNETEAESALFTIDALWVRRLGISSRRLRGVMLLACREHPEDALFHRAIGFGTLGDGSARTLEAIVRHYDRLGVPPRVEIAEGLTPSSSLRCLERQGFVREKEVHHVHVLETDLAPAAPLVRGLEVRPAKRGEAKLFGRLIRDGFELKGPLGEFLDRASAIATRTLPTSTATSLIAWMDGEPAGTGVLWMTPRVGGLYSASVLRPFRGRGIQKALVAERVRLGLARRRRIFTSQTAGDDPSAHNLHDMGFRRLYTAAYYLRPPSPGAPSRFDRDRKRRSRSSASERDAALFHP